ncbi:MAG TPA: TetR/AcrR family transcriptional regulator [Solimonas sp.]|nr:TetR/AcrR family transcriptional regulator [Solimonas sp.]
MRTRAALREALLTLLENLPIDQITIRDIAATAGIGYTTFFRHHPTKEALLDDLAAEEIRGLGELALSVMDADGARAASTGLFTLVWSRRPLWTVLLTGGAAAKLREELLRICLEIAADRTPPQASAPADVATLLAVSGTIELLSWWLRQTRPLPIAGIVDIHLKLVLLPVLDAQQIAVPQTAAPKKQTARTGVRKHPLRS